MSRQHERNTKNLPRGFSVEHPPSLELLDSYHNGRLSPEEEGQVRQHLVSCRACQRLLLDWVDFLECDRQESRLWSAELTAVWEEWLDRKERVSQAEKSRPQVDPASR